MRRKRELTNTEVQQTEIVTDDEKVQALLAARVKVESVKADKDEMITA